MELQQQGGASGGTVLRGLKFLDANLEKIVVVFVSLLLLFGCSASVFSRYLFNMSLVWTEEISLIALVWLAYIGASLSVIRRRHLRIEILPQLLLKKKGQKLVLIFANVAFFGFAVFVTYGTYEMTMLAFRTNQVFAATGISKWVSIAATPASFSLIAVRLIQDTIKLINEYKAMPDGE